jgi:3-methyladenine DNA glycosylase/8-oxoguanine DNA glycosylase
MPISPSQFEYAIRHLKSADPLISDLIDRARPFTLKLDRNRFGMLVRSILSQTIASWYCGRLIEVKNDPTMDASRYPV